ncbi:uracil phosphoribosyltransferase [Rothia sp. HMSC065D02]|uniref:uracil phosphoribosyltransferase n=1 Tax=Rothia sp. HMSC065D02 TaxID=1739518 RepID=UPI0008A5D965|nr:uracil phosphoribosyltransferase [Rothia sp. HMSC065D02]OFO75400.1 uracil phosphoribosyltransferase [Rothia sp. HMSC065D02]
MSTDKNFSTADNNDPQPPVEKQSASNNPENSQQEPKYTQLYGLEGADGKMSQASPGSHGAEGKEEPHKRISQQFDIDPNTREPLLIAQAIKNILIIIPALIILVFLVGGFIFGLIHEIDNISLTIITILIIIALPYIVHVILQIVAFMRFRKSVKFRWIRGVNIYGLIVAPISEVTYVPFMLERILRSYSSDGSSLAIVGVMVALYEVILGILMIVVTTNSIKKTDKSSEQKQHEVSEGVPDESL